MYLVFRFLLTLYILIKGKKGILFLKPLTPLGLKNTTIQLGVSFIKLAQVLATRSDFFDEDYLQQLKQLHDSLPPMLPQEFAIVFSNAFDGDVFDSFEVVPIASASIGQVHIAYKDGQKLAVKLKRFGIKKQVQADIMIIGFFNTLFKPLYSRHTKNSIEAVLNEFSKMILLEVSFKQELANLVEFSTIYKHSGVIFPVALEALCNDDAIVMSFIDGFRFDDKESLAHHHIDFRPLIAKLVDFYTEQMLVKGYFHADPHPGNLLVSRDGRLALLDFGMVKSVPNQTRVAIIELIKSANEADYEGYILANKKLGTIAYEAPTDELAIFTKKMFAIFSNENLNSESMQKLAFEVLESTRNLPFKLPADAIYILRVSAIIEGLGTTYIENFNGVKDILPILKENIPRALGAKNGFVENLKDEIGAFALLFKNIQKSAHKIARDELVVNVDKNQLDFLEHKLVGRMHRYAIGFACMLGGIFLLLLDGGQYETFASVLFGVGVVGIVFKKEV